MADSLPPLPSVLMVSKPIAPPWSDSSKNLVRDLARAGRRFAYHVLTPPDYRLERALLEEARTSPEGTCGAPRGTIRSEPIYGDRGRFAPALLQNVRVLLRLARADATALTHFFFAPNPRTSLAARGALLLRRRRTVQTVCSIPASFRSPEQLLFADRVIVLSQDTRRRFLEAGVPAGRLLHIPPGIELPSLPDGDERQRVRRSFGLPDRAPIAIYPGDYELRAGGRPGPAETFARAIPLVRDPGAHFVFACRLKKTASRQAQTRIEGILRAAGVRSRVLLLNEVREMLQLLAACDVCALPADDLYAKMDLPLVLLEALALELPIIVSNRPPLSELVSGEQGHGSAIPAGDPAALAHALDRWLAAGRQGAARTLAATRFEIGAISRDHEDLYQELLQSP